jgi:maleylacetoacetate isomerase
MPLETAYLAGSNNTSKSTNVGLLRCTISIIKLYDYPKSSASYRVRIALNLAGLEYEIININLLDGAHKKQEHLSRNPQGLVPVLDIDGERLTQSLAILEYLNDTRKLGLLPSDARSRATCRALAYSIAVDIHPICNLSVMEHATGGVDPARTEWMQHFIRPGLLAFEKLIENFASTKYATGDTPGLADICLIPQLYNARRWNVDYSDLTRISSIEKQCESNEAFQRAGPDHSGAPGAVTAP